LETRRAEERREEKERRGDVRGRKGSSGQDKRIKETRREERRQLHWKHTAPNDRMMV